GPPRRRGRGRGRGRSRSGWTPRRAARRRRAAGRAPAGRPGPARRERDRRCRGRRRRGSRRDRAARRLVGAGPRRPSREPLPSRTGSKPPAHGQCQTVRIFTWHVHGAYLRSLLAVEHEWVVPVRRGRPAGYAGLPADGPPWPPNVREVPADAVRDLDLDVVVLQHRRNWERDQHEILSDAQRAGPRIHVEHDPPFAGPPTDSRHPVDDPGVLLVHVTPYNALMWDSGDVPTRVIQHGVTDRGALWTGELE